jgi:hypothetical protein
MHARAQRMPAGRRRRSSKHAGRRGSGAAARAHRRIVLPFACEAHPAACTLPHTSCVLRLLLRDGQQERHAEAVAERRTRCELSSAGLELAFLVPGGPDD